MTQTADPNDLLGADLRALRKTRGLTLSQLAGRLGCSVGWLSQVERDISSLAQGDIQRVAEVLDIPAETLAPVPGISDAEQGYVVRRNGRRALRKGIPGLTEELLSPDLTDDFEVVHSTFAAGSEITQPVTRPTQEVGIILSGQLDLKIGTRRFTVGSGDSFRIRGEAFTWANPYDQTAIAVWVIAPPVY